MKYYRCRCGKREAWGSDPPPACAWCDECNSSLAGSPNTHRERIDHDWYEQMVQTDDGLKPLTRCRYCLRPKHVLDKQNLSPGHGIVSAG